MKLTMVSHASVLIEEGDVALLTDPWLMGSVFNDSWSLVSEPAMTPTDLKSVTHIWISHEHPDHLHFPSIMAIPPEDRAQIEILYQRHLSPRIASELGCLGFKGVRELPPGRWVEIGGNLSIMCLPVGTIDSLMAVKSAETTILNLNDCVLGGMAARAAAKRVGTVDVLLTQFSFANWVGNPEDTDISGAVDQIARMRRYIEVFRPKTTVPFASFVYFSNEENRFMNAWSNTPKHVCQELRDAPTQIQFLYNGDSWLSDNSVQLAGDPVEKYQAEFENVPHRIYHTHPTNDLNEIVELGQALADKVRRTFRWLPFPRAAPVYFYVYDWEKAVCFDLRRGIFNEVDRVRSECDREVGSQALWYAVKYPWGFGTLDVSGRYKVVNRNANMWALRLCSVHSAAFELNGSWTKLLTKRSISFLWSQRYEALDRTRRNFKRALPFA